MDRPDLDDDATGPIRRITDEVSPSPARGTSGTSRKPARRTPAEGARRAADPARRRTDTGPQRVPAADKRADTGPQRATGSLRVPAENGQAEPRRRRGDTGPQRATGTSARPRRKAPAETEAAHAGHGHGHGHGPAAPASRRVKLLLIWLLAPLALATVVGMVVLYPWGKASPTSVVPQGTPVHADIRTTATGPCLAQGQVQVGDQTDPNAKPCLTVDLTMTDGPADGKPLRLTVPIEPSTPRFAAGDAVVLAYNGGNSNDPASFQLVDFQRGTPLLVLAALFAVAVLVLGRWQGVAALVALGLSFVVIALFILPAILAGENPLVVAIAGAGAIMFIALYLTHGLSARTSAAVLGTLVSLALIGVLSAIFSAAASLTGLDDSTSTLIGSLGHGIDARGLLLAGVVIGALGVLDDVTVTQTSAVWELRRANPDLTWRELYHSGLRIGRDHVGSAVNTLVMAYAGAALPVLLYSSISGVGLGALLGSEDIAQEIIRTLAGSVGIVAAVPVTTVLAALIASREPAGHLGTVLSPASPRSG
ncbi:YibE/F family protein [Amycolatopsis sp. NPDC003731]